MGNFIKKQIKGRAMKMPMAILVCALLVVGAGIAYEAVAVGSVTITPVSNGGSISIDTTSNADNTGSSEFTFLSGPTITESMAGDIAEGIHTITLPSGWEFDTTSNITFYSTGVILSSANVVPNQYSFSFDVTSKSTSASVLGFMGLKVRPTGTTPSSGNIAHSGAGILGINESINFGTLATIAGTVTQVAFTTQPGDAMYGFVLNPQPVVKTQDQFGNDSTNGLTPDNNVVLTLNETGGLVGTTFLNIGTNEGNGTVIFSGLTVNVAGNGNTLTASATGLTPDTSDSFDITPKNINVTAQIDTKVYDGNANSSKTPTVDALAFSDTVAIQPIQEFDSKNIDASLLVPSGLGITGGNNNYNITYIDASGAITKQEVTVTGATTDSKIYDGDADADVDFSNSTLNGVVSEEDVTLDLTNESASFDTKNVGSENPVTVSGLVLGGIDAGNYSLTQPTLNDGVITKRTLTVTAVGDDKVYDGNTIATVTPLDNRVSDDILTVDYTSSSFVDENVGDNKPVNVSGISISGTDAGNYALGNTTAVTSADITAKGLTVINSAVTPKTYDGTRAAVNVPDP